MGYAHPGTITHDFHRSILNVLGNSKHQVAAVGIRCGALISPARNDLVKATLEEDFEAMWSVDSDMVFNHETLDALVEADEPIASALYLGIDYGGDTFPIANMEDPDGRWLRAPMEMFETGEHKVPVDGIGMGCALIKRKVLEDLEVGELWPFSETLYKGIRLEEDLTFCRRARSKGYKPVVLPLVRAGHVKTIVI